MVSPLYFFFYPCIHEYTHNHCCYFWCFATHTQLYLLMHTPLLASLLMMLYPPDSATHVIVSLSLTNWHCWWQGCHTQSIYTHMLRTPVLHTQLGRELVSKKAHYELHQGFIQDFFLGGHTHVCSTTPTFAETSPIWLKIVSGLVTSILGRLMCIANWRTSIDWSELSPNNKITEYHYKS